MLSIKQPSKIENMPLANLYGEIIMKKIAFILGLVFITSSFAADESCLKSCDSGFTQNSLMCHKIMQICLRHGPIGDEGADMCFGDYQNCVDNGRNVQKACYSKCEEQ